MVGWIKNGPFPAGKFSDLKIARERLTLSLEISEFEDEMVLADGGYQDGYLHFETPTGEVNEDQHMSRKVLQEQDMRPSPGGSSYGRY
jgi:hypothetical protein